MHNVIRDDKPRQHFGQVAGNAHDRAGQNAFRVGRQVEERNGNQRKGFIEHDARKDRNGDIEKAKDQPDHAADGEHAPAPRLLFAGRFRKGGRARCGDRSHREGQALDVRRDAEQQIARTHPVQAVQHLVQQSE